MKTLRHQAASLRAPTTGEAGYMIEYQLIFAAVIIFLCVVGPMLPLWAFKIAAVLAAVPLIWCLHYMIVTPGWRPGVTPLPRPLALVAFAFAAVFVIAIVAVFVCCA